MDTLADKLAALLGLAALKLVRLRISSWYLYFLIWKLRQLQPGMLPELPETAIFPNALFISALTPHLQAFGNAFRFNPYDDTLEMSGIEAKKLLALLQEKGRAAAIRRVRATLLEPFVAMVSAP